jgi:hypothetical protein
VLLVRAFNLSSRVHLQRGLSATTVINVFLWIARAVVFAVFASAGIMKLALPVPRIAKIWPWTGQVSGPSLRLIGVVDLAGGVGVIVPALTHIYPRVGFVAALCCGVLQVFAIVFHMRRGEAGLTPFNFVVLALCAFVSWGTLKG